MKEIKLIAELGTNYIFHLLAVAKNNYDNSYSRKYASSISNKHREILQKFKERLNFANGNAGDLVEYLIFFPAYLGLNSQNDLERYFGLIKKAAHGRPEGFIKEYREKISERKWLPKIDDRWFEMLHEKLEEIEMLKEVYIDNFTTYKNLVWPYEFPQMKKKADRLNEKLKGLNLIEKWEKVTGKSFKAKKYEIVLVSAIEGGPNANSLGYSKNVFYSESESSFMIDFISHEVGTHILSDVAFEFFQALSTKPEKMAEFYGAYECIAQFFNSLVLNRELSYDLKQFNSERYISAFRELYSVGINAPKELLMKTLET
ncbi:hypothetical protein [Kosmotoga arenicorallina]|uniref:hypothetical protein n=1 Tax=Kosmotoga arenicorallina TaxID=688066 RepID=UPI000ADD4DE1|nr:hypothetical protein [Kosmotoga arenicorallina]